MTNSPMVRAIVRRLHEAGYKDIATPFRIATVEFQFTSALRGSDKRALDLVIIIDTTTGEYGDRDAVRVRNRVEALSRALDVTRSRFVVTVVLAGAALGPDIDGLSESCRLLYVDVLQLKPNGDFVSESARMMLDDRIGALLPLVLPIAAHGTDAGTAPVIEQLQNALPAASDRALLMSVFSASEQGEEAVTDAMAAALGNVLRMEGDQ